MSNSLTLRLRRKVRGGFGGEIEVVLSVSGSVDENASEIDAVVAKMEKMQGDLLARQEMETARLNLRQIILHCTHEMPPANSDLLFEKILREAPLPEDEKTQLREDYIKAKADLVEFSRGSYASGEDHSFFRRHGVAGNE